MFTYHIPPGVSLVWQGKRPLLSLPPGGRVATDRRLVDLWRLADGCTLAEALPRAQALGCPPGESAAGLACLAQAGLLERRGAPLPEPPGPPPVQGRVSVVIVGYNSREWLPGCLESLRAQTHPPHEIILIDNASSDGSAEWLAQNAPEVRLLRLAGLQPLSLALNLGAQMAQGDYLLVLNPDVVLEPHALAWMLAAASPGCAAVAAKLRFLWAPAFLNGLGNLVGALSWGTDSGLGWLDLGQFDGWAELPSACFAAALLPLAAYQAVGPFDEGFPMYYEDTEWGYRARLLGYTIRAAPRAIVYHAFSSRVPAGQPVDLPALKLRRVASGRLRWITRLLGPAAWLRFALGYALEDLGRAGLALLRGRLALVRAYIQAWGDFRRSLPELRPARRACKARRRINDRALLQPQRVVPVPLIWRGLPLLTWEVVQSCYAPWLAAQAARFPEWQGDAPAPLPPTAPPGRARRAALIVRLEGLGALFERLGRSLIWRLAKP